MSKSVLGATALALLIGVSAFSLNTAAAQNGSEARSNDRANQKKLDNRELTPIRPIRRVGEDSWPTAKNQPAPVRETTGQSAKESSKETTADKTEKKTDTAQNTPKPESKPDTKASNQNPNLGNQSPPPDKPESTAKQNVQPKQDTAKQENKQDAKQNTAQNAKQNTAQNKDDKDSKGFASIRLGTDESGHVAVNEAQQRQIAKAIRRQHVESVKVSVGSVAPADVRLVAVSSELVDVLPQFRGDSMFATADGIMIVEPSSRKVIALVPVKLTATASRAPAERTTETRSRPSARTASRQRDVTVSQNEERYPTREEILAAPVTRGPAGTTVTRTYRSYQYDPDDDDDVVVIQRPRRRIFGFW